jgi:hypothetical protein
MQITLVTLAKEVMILQRVVDRLTYIGRYYGTEIIVAKFRQ